MMLSAILLLNAGGAAQYITTPALGLLQATLFSLIFSEKFFFLVNNG
jgi:hypothetical protein